jgi:hypothetical protein
MVFFVILGRFKVAENELKSCKNGFQSVGTENPFERQTTVHELRTIVEYEMPENRASASSNTPFSFRNRRAYKTIPMEMNGV